MAEDAGMETMGAPAGLDRTQPDRGALACGISYSSECVEPAKCRTRNWDGVGVAAAYMGRSPTFGAETISRLTFRSEPNDYRRFRFRSEHSLLSRRIPGRMVGICRVG